MHQISLEKKKQFRSPFIKRNAHNINLFHTIHGRHCLLQNPIKMRCDSDVIARRTYSAVAARSKNKRQFSEGIFPHSLSLALPPNNSDVVQEMIGRILIQNRAAAIGLTRITFPRRCAHLMTGADEIVQNYQLDLSQNIRLGTSCENRMV
jgi:hypothetical protein